MALGKLYDLCDLEMVVAHRASDKWTWLFN